jgi:4-hydroxybenzoate polyprenyltransferase
MIYIYLAIGLTIFFVLQFVSTRSVIDSGEYNVVKGAAWLSLPFWPIVLIFTCVGLLAFGLCMAIEYSDRRIDKVMRKKK